MRFLPRPPRRSSGFTLIELLTVIAIIAILAGLILTISGTIQKNAARSRAQSEIAAITSACENYKTDNGGYPYIVITGTPSINYSTHVSNIPSDQLDPRLNGNSASTNLTYANASLELYVALTSDTNNTGLTIQLTGSNNYLPSIKQDMLGRINPTAPVNATSNRITFLQDPFGNIYGYSTANNFYTACVNQGWQSTATAANPAPGYNSTFDIWSTGGQFGNPNPAATAGQQGDPQLQWIKNW
jgi:prepilin-type N-terminal cleavage/methylation domain-containing protein